MVLSLRGVSHRSQRLGAKRRDICAAPGSGHHGQILAVDTAVTVVVHREPPLGGRQETAESERPAQPGKFLSVEAAIAGELEQIAGGVVDCSAAIVIHGVA